MNFVARWLLKRKLRGWLKRAEEAGMLNGVKALFGGSKKLTTVLIGIVTVLLRDLIGLDEATVALIVKLIMTYLVGQSALDSVLAFKGAKTQ